MNEAASSKEKRGEQMKQPKKPSLSQKKLIVDNGLNPDDYGVHFEDALYLHIVPKNGKLQDVVILDKKKAL